MVARVNGQPMPQVVAHANIAMMTTGEVKMECGSTNLALLLGMLDIAKENILAKMRAVPDVAIEVAPANLLGK